MALTTPTPSQPLRKNVYIRLSYAFDPQEDDVDLSCPGLYEDLATGRSIVVFANGPSETISGASDWQLSLHLDEHGSKWQHNLTAMSDADFSNRDGVAKV